MKKNGGGTEIMKSQGYEKNYMERLLIVGPLAVFFCILNMIGIIGRTISGTEKSSIHAALLSIIVLSEILICLYFFVLFSLKKKEKDEKPLFLTLSGLTLLGSVVCAALITIL